MKKIMLAAAMLWICHSSVAQSKQEIAFEAASTLFDQKEYSKAAEAFAKLMVDFPKHELKPRAHFNLGLAYYRMQDTTRAKATFVSILAQGYNERDENNLMEPYALYKHHASRNLASIALGQKKFDEAEKYIGLFHKKYPYQHFCGNEWAAYAIFKAVMDAKVFEGKRQPELAVKALAPHLFYNGLAGNKGALDEMSEILERNFQPSEVKEMFGEALNSLRFEKTKGKPIPVITFKGVTVPLERYIFEDDRAEQNLDHYKNVVRANELFLKFL